ncbi:unnamed protein product [Rotaria sordida]|uniref:Uncharacterized protein n=1 Tax=Rotaria sordida TaxID=392033 RepID=A0A815I148_9BILA|nr:unnamed protein product [Rotaria sordida]CAF1359743.1 unnamed protein product [Rotaria sordida]
MATATDKNLCTICNKERRTVKCEGCSQNFCYNHLENHRQELSKQLDDVEVAHDLFRQTLTEKISQPQKHPLIEQINKWEYESINKIRQTAEEARQFLFKHTTRHITQIEDGLNKLTDQLRQCRQDNDFVEIDVYKWEEQLARLQEELSRPANIRVRQDSTPFITKIDIDVSDKDFIFNARWIHDGITVAGGNGQGNTLNQLYCPWSVFVDDDQTIYIADCYNHRILEWKCSATYGQVVAGGNGEGNRPDQLNGPTDVIVDKESDCLIICDRRNRQVVQWPRRNGTNGQTIISDIDCWSLAMDNNGYLYVSDTDHHEVRRWKMGDTSGTVVAGGNGKGNHLNQFDCPTYIFVDENRSVYVSDQNNHRVMKWMEGTKEGIVVAGSQHQGNDLTQLSCPSGVTVDQLGTVYVVDSWNHRVMCWSKEATQGNVVVGGNEHGEQANQLNHPLGLSFDQKRNLYVTDQNNHRIQKFNIDSSSHS